MTSLLYRKQRNRVVASLFVVQRNPTPHTPVSWKKPKVPQALMMKLIHTQLRLVSSRNNKVKKAKGVCILTRCLYVIIYHLLSLMQRRKLTLTKCNVSPPVAASTPEASSPKVKFNKCMNVSDQRCI